MYFIKYNIYITPQLQIDFVDVAPDEYTRYNIYSEFAHIHLSMCVIVYVISSKYIARILLSVTSTKPHNSNGSFQKKATT